MLTFTVGDLVSDSINIFSHFLSEGVCKHFIAIIFKFLRSIAFIIVCIPLTVHRSLVQDTFCYRPAYVTQYRLLCDSKIVESINDWWLRRLRALKELFWLKSERFLIFHFHVPPHIFFLLIFCALYILGQIVDTHFNRYIKDIFEKITKNYKPSRELRFSRLLRRH